MKPYRTPTTRAASAYRYQYINANCQADLLNADVVRWNIVEYDGETNTVIQGNGGNKQNPLVEIFDLATRDVQRVHVIELLPVCLEDNATCNCAHHLTVAAFKATGPFHANIGGGQNALVHNANDPEVDVPSVEELTAIIANMTLENRSALYKTILSRNMI